jgi:hypothetical protein
MTSRRTKSFFITRILDELPANSIKLYAPKFGLTYLRRPASIIAFRSVER